MHDLHGIWHNETAMGDVSVSTTHVLGEGDFRSEIVYTFADGSRQHIHHTGTFTAKGGHLRLTLGEGTTRKEGGDDDFALRPFTPEEWDETVTMLAPPIAYHVDGDTLHTTVEGPHGALAISYERVAA